MLHNVPKNLPSHISLRVLRSHIDHGNLPVARSIFDAILTPDLRMWTTLISGYMKQGLPKEAIQLYDQLIKDKNIKPDKYALLPVTKACAITSDLDKAKEVHADATRLGLHTDLMLGNALIHMYGKCCSPSCARIVFGSLAEKDVISWTSVIAAYVCSNISGEALQLFREMTFSGVKPNSVTVSSILPACSNVKALNFGKEIHGFIFRNGLVGNVYASSGLVDVYAKCLSIREARKVFDSMPHRDTVLWNAMLAALCSNGESGEAIKLLDMMKTEGPSFDSATWNSVIGGCSQNGYTELALTLFSQMQWSGIKPNNMTIASVLPAYSNLENMRGGKVIHAYSLRQGFMEDIAIITALILMYAKCGDLNISRRIFTLMPHKDTVAWNTIILANSMHGCGQEALSCFQRMLDTGRKPNAATFTAVLSGCSHSQLIDEGLCIFHSMSRNHGVEPDVDHYSCMVDILCRAGALEKAYKFIQKMPIEPSAGAWGSLLSGCRLHKNIELGEVAAKRLFEIEPNNTGNYILLSNMYFTSKLWADASKVRKMMRDKGIAKEPGCSWIQIDGKVHTFMKGDMRHFYLENCYNILEELGGEVES